MCKLKKTTYALFLFKDKCGIIKRSKKQMEELKQMAKKKEPTNGELMAKEIIAKYKP